MSNSIQYPAQPINALSSQYKARQEETFVNSVNGKTGNVNLYSNDIQITDENTDTIFQELEKLNNVKLDREEHFIQLANDFIPPTEDEAHILFSNGDGTYRTARLAEVGVVQKEETLVRNTTQQTILGSSPSSQIILDQFNNIGTKFINSGNGVEVIDASDDFEIAISVPCFISAKKNSYPITLKVELYQNSNPTGLIKEIVVSADQTAIFKENFSSTLLIINNNDVFTLQASFRSNAGNLNNADEFIIDIPSYMIFDDTQYLLGGLGIPSNYLYEKRASVSKAYTDTQAFSDVAELGSLLTFDSLTFKSNDGSLMYDDTIHAFVLKNETHTTWDYKISVPCQKVAGGSAGAVQTTGILEYSSDSTDGQNGVWQQVNSINNAPIQNITDSGVTTIEYLREIDLPQVGYYRIRVYMRDVDSGTISHSPYQAIDSTTGFQVNRTAVATLTERGIS